MFGHSKRVVDEINADRDYVAANPPKCGNCFNWVKGFCRRYPPPFPPTAELAWCGEYKRLWPGQVKP